MLLIYQCQINQKRAWFIMRNAVAEEQLLEVHDPVRQQESMIK